MTTGNFCDAEVLTGCPVSLCGQHVMAAYRFCADVLNDVERAERYERFVALDKRRTRDTGNAVVYYVLFASQIKIGTTTHIRQRLRQLQPDAILAVESGWTDLEAERHRQFYHLRVEGRREYFHAGRDLIDFIEALPKDNLPEMPKRRGPRPWPAAA